MITRHFIPFLILALYLLLQHVHSISAFIGLLPVVSGLGITWILIYLLYAPPRPSLTEILALALAYRLIFLFDTPILSDDLYRYVWDGWQLLHGVNPYARAPLEMAGHPVTAHVQRGIFEHINHPGLVTIYPPVAQWIFLMGAWALPDLVGVKCVLVALDTILIVVLWNIMDHGDKRSVALYAWHPLPVIEIAQSGHIDGAMALLFLCGIMAIEKRRFVASGILIGSSVSTKLMSAVLIPILIKAIPGHKGHRVRLVAGIIAGILLPSLFFFPHITNMLKTLATYVTDWEFSGFLYQTLHSFTGCANARIVLLALFVCASVVIILKVHDMYVALASTFLLFLLTQPTLYPWYAIPFTCLLPLARVPVATVFPWALFLSYLVLIPYKTTGQWIESTTATSLIFMAGMFSLASLLIKKRGEINEY